MDYLKNRLIEQVATLILRITRLLVIPVCQKLRTDADAPERTQASLESGQRMSFGPTASFAVTFRITPD